MGLRTPTIDRRLRALFAKILVWVALLFGAVSLGASAQTIYWTWDLPSGGFASQADQPFGPYDLSTYGVAADSSHTIDFYVDASTPLPAGLSLTEAGILSGTPTTSGTYTITFTADDDNAEKSYDATTTITIAEAWVWSGTPSLSGRVADAFTTVDLTDYGSDPDGSSASVDFEVVSGSLPAGLRLDNEDIFGTPTVAGSGSVTVRATDLDGLTSDLTINWTVSAAYWAWSLPGDAFSGQADQPFGPYDLSTYGVAGESDHIIDFSATGLPTGLTLTDTGTLSGTPTVDGTFTVTFTARDDNVEKSYDATTTITIAEALSPAWAWDALPSGGLTHTVGESVLVDVSAYGTNLDDTRDVDFNVTGLPSGLVLQSSGGQVSGTPTQAGTSTVTLTAEDDLNGPVVAGTLTWTIESAPEAWVWSGTPSLSGRVAEAFTTVDLTDYGSDPDGSSASVDFEVVSGSLPAGLRLDNEDIFGTPTVAGSGSVTVRATDLDGLTSDLTINWTVSAAYWAWSLPGDAFSGQADQPFGPYDLSTYGVAGESDHIIDFSATGLPTGLTLTDTGTLSGTPTVDGTFTVTFTARDDNVEKSYDATTTITIAEALSPAWAWDALPSGGLTHTVGESVLVDVSAYGTNLDDTRDVDFNVTGLPSGLVLQSSGGQVSGTPTQAGTSTVTLTAEDDLNGPVVAGTLTWTIESAPEAWVWSGTPSLSGRVAEAFTTVDLTDYGSDPDGSSASVDFEVVSGSLPAGLRLDNEDIFGTPTVAGSGSVTVRATDLDGLTSDLTINWTVSAAYWAWSLPGDAFSGQADQPFGPYDLSTYGVAGESDHIIDFSATGLPTGLTLTDTGTLSGTPTVDGTFTVTFTARDDNVEKSYDATTTITIAEALSPAWAWDALPSGGLTHTVGESVLVDVSAYGTNLDDTRDVDFNVTGLPSGLVLQSSGGQVSGTPTQAGTSTVTLTAEDDLNGPVVAGTLTWTIESAPEAWVWSGTPSLSGRVAEAFTTVDLTDYGSDPDGSSASVDFEVVSGSLPAGLRLDNEDIFGTPTVAGSGSVTVRATDLDGLTSDLTINWTVSAAYWAWSLPGDAFSGQADQPFGPYDLSTYGVAGESDHIIDFSATGLPTGLTLTDTGTLSGTPTVDGTFTVTFTARDDNVEKSYDATTTITIAEALSPAWAWDALPSGGLTHTVGESVLVDVSAYGTNLDDTRDVDFNVTGLPSGLVLQSSGGQVSGTPTQAGTSTVTLTAEDDLNGPVVAGTLTWTIESAPEAWVWSGTPSLSGRVAEAFTTVDLTDYGSDPDGSSASVDFEVVSGSLPAGLRLDNEDIFGTPTVAGSGSVTVRATDLDGLTSDLTINWTVSAAYWAWSLPGDAFSGQADQPFGPYDLSTYGVAGESDHIIDFSATGLPTGLTLTDTGTLSGTPTVDGTFTVTFTARDDNVEKSYDATTTITIAEALSPAWAWDALPSGGLTHTVGESVLVDVSAYGTNLDDTRDVDFNVTGLPSGLVLQSSGGQVSGTPTQAGTSTVTLTAEDDLNGPVVAGTLTWTIESAPEAWVWSGTPSLSGRVAEAFTTVDLTDYGSDPDGSSASVDFEVVSGSLPAGLRLDNEDIFGTPTVAGSGSVTVRATDLDGLTSDLTINWTVSAAYWAWSLPGDAFSGQADQPFGPYDLSTYGVAGESDHIIDFSATGLPTGLTLTDTGTLSGTPTVDGTFTVTFTARDDNVEKSYDATTTITIEAAPNEPPVASNTRVVTQLNMPVDVDVAPFIFDVDGDDLSVTFFSEPSNGSVSLNGTVFRYEPTAGFSGADEFNYTVSDGVASATALVSLVVEGGGLPVASPISNDIHIHMSGRESVAIELSHYVNEPELNSLLYSVTGPPTSGVASLTGSRVIYSRGESFSGEDTIQYTVARGQHTDSGTIYIYGDLVTDRDIIKVSTAEFRYDALGRLELANHDTGSVDYVAWCYDKNGNRLAVESGTGIWDPSICPQNSDDGGQSPNDEEIEPLPEPVTPPAFISSSTAVNTTTISVPSGTQDGDLMVGVFAGYHGSPGSITLPVGWTAIGGLVTQSDDIYAQHAYKVAGSSEAAFTYGVGNGEYPVAGIVTYRDAEGIGAFNFENGQGLTRTNAGVSATQDNSVLGLFSIGYSNSLNSEPAGMTQRANWDNGVSFIWTEELGVAGATGTRNSTHNNLSTPDPNDTFTTGLIEILGVTGGSGGGGSNQAPIAVSDASTTAYEAAVTIDVLANDNDPEGGALSVELRSQPLSGTASVSGTSIVYTPDAGFSGSDSFTYRVLDPDGAVSSDATVSVTVEAEAGGGSIVAPAFISSSTAVNTTTISVPSGTQDGDLMVGVFAGYHGSPGSITLPVGWTAIGGLVTQSDDIYAQHAYKVAGSSEAAFTYGVGNGEYPVAGIVTYRDAEGIGAFNFENGQGLTRTNAGVSATQDNSVLGLFSIGYSNSLNSEPAGMTQRANWDNGVSFIWTEELGVAGATGTRNSTHNNLSTPDPNDTFTTGLIEILGVTGGSGGGGSNQAPIAVSDASTTAYEAAVTIDVLANDNDPEGGALSVELRSQPLSGTASVSGTSIVYTPDAGFSGSDSFTYRVLDPDGAVSSDATVSVTVEAEAGGGSIVAPAFISSSTAVNTTTISVPSGTQDGDLMVGVFAGYHGSPGSITLPVGWTAIGGLVTQSDDIYAQHAYKVAGSSEAAFTYGVGNGEYPVAGIVTYRDAEGIGAFNFENGQGLTRTNAGVSATQDNSVLGLFSIGYSNSLNSEPAGMTQRANWDNGVSFIWTEELGVAGATGTRNSTHNNLSTPDPNDTFTTGLIEILGAEE